MAKPTYGNMTLVMETTPLLNVLIRFSFKFTSI